MRTLVSLQFVPVEEEQGSKLSSKDWLPERMACHFCLRHIPLSSDSTLNPMQSQSSSPAMYWRHQGRDCTLPPALQALLTESMPGNLSGLEQFCTNASSAQRTLLEQASVCMATGRLGYINHLEGIDLSFN